MERIIITDEIKKEYLKVIIKVIKDNRYKFKFKKSFKQYITKYLLSKSIPIQTVLLGNLNELRSLIDTHGDDSNFYKGKKALIDEIYGHFRKEWGYELVKLLNIKVCLYCNRNFIVNYDIDKTTVELDHFFPKSKYPYLAISLYNLIPVCHTCNHIKKEKILKVHPFEESLNKSFIFEYNGIKSSEILNKKRQGFFDINRIKSSIKTVNSKIEIANNDEWDYIDYIKKLYEEHKDIISELLQKRVIYSDDYIDELLKKYKGRLFKNKEDLLRLITCGYIEDKDIIKRPLSKLIKDISEQLKFI